VSGVPDLGTLQPAQVRALDPRTGMQMRFDQWSKKLLAESRKEPKRYHKTRLDELYRVAFRKKKLSFYNYSEGRRQAWSAVNARFGRLWPRDCTHFEMARMAAVMPTCSIPKTAGSSSHR
jgi:hypothetical protein